MYAALCKFVSLCQSLTFSLSREDNIISVTGLHLIRPDSILKRKLKTARKSEYLIKQVCFLLLVIICVPPIIVDS